ncbi:MAG TPA: MATE family efflux transporter [Bacillota bacterium]
MPETTLPRAEHPQTTRDAGARSKTDLPRLRAAIWALTWPVVAEQSLMTVTQVVDAIMVAKLGAAAIAAVNLSFQPFWLLSSIFMGLSIGTTALVARCTGAGDPKGAGAVTRQSFLLAAVFGVFSTALAVFFARRIVAMMGAQPEVIDLGLGYVRALAPGLFFLTIQTVLSAAMRGAGDTRTPMVVNTLTNVAHIFTNWLLIFGHWGFPAMGVVGAGISTSLTRIAGGVWLFALLLTTDGPLRLHLRRLFTIDWPTMTKVIRIGLPAALERAVSSVGQIVYAREVAALGTTPVAAHYIALNIESLSYMPGMGFSAAASTLVGHDLGARRPKQAAASSWETLRFGLWVMGTMGVLFFLFPAFFMRVFTVDPDIVRLGLAPLRIVAFTQFFECIGFIIQGALRGAGDTQPVLWATTVGLIIRLIATAVFVFAWHLGLAGAWLAMLLDWIFRAGGSLWYFRTGRWTRVRV